jgi:cytidylate kinase
MAILSISRECESGGWEIGRKVAEQTGYDFIDKERIRAELKAAGERWEYLGEEMDEVRPNLWEKFDWEYQGLIALIESSIYEYALKDRVVLLGRGNNFLLKDVPHVLKLRLSAPFETRVRRLMEKSSMDRTTAEWLIKKVDRNRAGYIKAIYGEDWEAKENYDLVFDTGEQSQEQIVPVVLEALKERDRLFTAEGLQRLQGYALAAKIKARIYTQPKMFIPTLEIIFDGLALVIRGVVHSTKEYHWVEEMVQKMADPHPIRNELHYRT